jgi:pimeloyl-ACP methyl ester carboxylesterase
VPELAWEECPDEGWFFLGEPPGGAEPPPGEELPPPPTFQCADATVPLDYDDPDGPTTTLSVKRRVADDPANRIGSLFVNPGGPGGSGVDFVSAADFTYPTDVLARFDVVGFDPRGITRSDPLVCFSDGEEFFEFHRFLPTFPVTPAEERQVAAAFEELGRLCEERGGGILRHMSTGDVVRDLDLLRQAVDDERLTFAGYSYGSHIGTTYANMFPGRVRAIMIDGVLDPVAWTTGVRPSGSPEDWARRSALPVSTRVRSAEGSWATFQQFAALCRRAGPERCALAEGDPLRRVADLAARLREQPAELPQGGGFFFRVGFAELVSLTVGALYSPGVWAEYAEFVEEIERFRDPAAAARSYRELAGRLGLAAAPGDPEGEEPPAGEPPLEEPPLQSPYEVYTGVMCADSDNPSTPRWWRWASRESDRRAPYFGRYWTWQSIACASWPARSVEDRYAGPWNARTANPVLVVGNRWDPATPYSGALHVSRLLPGSRLLTLRGWGHVASGQSTCIDSAVEAYLLEGTLPPVGAVCRPDLEPFAEDEPGEGLRAAGVEGQAGREAARRALLDAALPPLARLR